MSGCSDLIIHQVDLIVVFSGNRLYSMFLIFICPRGPSVVVFGVLAE